MALRQSSKICNFFWPCLGAPNQRHARAIQGKFLCDLPSLHTATLSNYPKKWFRNVNIMEFSFVTYYNQTLLTDTNRIFSIDIRSMIDELSDEVYFSLGCRKDEGGATVLLQENNWSKKVRQFEHNGEYKKNFSSRNPDFSYSRFN